MEEALGKTLEFCTLGEKKIFRKRFTILYFGGKIFKTVLFTMWSLYIYIKCYHNCYRKGNVDLSFQSLYAVFPV